jgi:hypothetical protein
MNPADHAKWTWKAFENTASMPVNRQFTPTRNLVQAQHHKFQIIISR